MIRGLDLGGLVILLLFVIPTFQTMFQSFDQQLPLPTRIVIGMSAFLQSYWWALLAGSIGFVWLFRQWLATSNGRLLFDRVLLRVPILGTLARKSAVARFTRTLGTLLSSGVSILDGLEITAKTAGNRIVKDAVMETRKSIEELRKPKPRKPLSAEQEARILTEEILSANPEAASRVLREWAQTGV